MRKLWHIVLCSLGKHKESPCVYCHKVLCKGHWYTRLELIAELVLEARREE